MKNEKTIEYHPQAGRQIKLIDVKDDIFSLGQCNCHGLELNGR